MNTEILFKDEFKGRAYNREPREIREKGESKGVQKFAEMEGLDAMRQYKLKLL